jgi:hypothetical protein
MRYLAMGIAILTTTLGCGQGRKSERSTSGNQGAWLDSFDMKDCTWSTRGENRYFILRPGYQVVLGKRSGRRSERVQITVLEDTERVDEVETRVVEEREFQDGRLTEISRNFFAICTERNDVFDFGEDVVVYEHGTAVAHTGEWRAGRNGARAGLEMPGNPRNGLRYYEEIAPGVALDRAEIDRSDDALETIGGKFSNCLKVIETSPLNPGDRGLKRYAPGIGLIQDDDLTLVRYGRVEPDTIELPDGLPRGDGPVSEVEITFEEMPPALARKIRQLYPTGRIHEVKRELHPGARAVYAVEVLVGGKQYDVVAGWKSGFDPREPFVFARLPSPGGDEEMVRSPGEERHARVTHPKGS